MNAILALDLGTTAGWAVNSDGQVISGTASFRPGRFEGGGMRFPRFRGRLEELAGASGAPSAVYFEAVRRHAGVDAAHVYDGLMATLTAWCEQRSIPYTGVPVSTIKRHCNGKGNADNSATVVAVRARDFNLAHDNEADAAALLDWAIEQLATSASGANATKAALMR